MTKSSDRKVYKTLQTYYKPERLKKTVLENLFFLLLPALQEFLKISGLQMVYFDYHYSYGFIH